MVTMELPYHSFEGYDTAISNEGCVDALKPIPLSNRARFGRFYEVRQEPTIQKTGNRREKKVIHRKTNLKGIKRGK